MIGCFPTPYKDEFIYSILSRYNLISSNGSEHITSKEFFSRAMWEIKMDLFPHAKKLETKLAHFNFYSAEEIIENFSFFNYYNKFSRNKDKFQSLMLVGRPGLIKSELYCHDIEIYNPEYYRFCLKCFKEDSESGVPYWHITHNLPGVTYCKKHKCKLVLSDVEFNGKKLIALSSRVKMSVLPVLNDWEEKILKLISEQTIYLFYTKNAFRDTRTPYISYLYEKGYFKNFVLDERSLIKDFIDFYSDNICKLININEDKEYVISTVIRKIKDNGIRDCHPLFHILFITFCDKKITDLNESNQITIPFDSKLIIEETGECFEGFFIHNSFLGLKNGRLVGTVECSCGNHYSLDFSNQKIKVHYGEKFLEQVWELLFIEDLSVSEICCRLNISKTDLKNYIISKK